MTRTVEMMQSGEKLPEDLALAAAEKTIAFMDEPSRAEILAVLSYNAWNGDKACATSGPLPLAPYDTDFLEIEKYVTKAMRIYDPADKYHDMYIQRLRAAGIVAINLIELMATDLEQGSLTPRLVEPFKGVTILS